MNGLMTSSAASVPRRVIANTDNPTAPAARITAKTTRVRAAACGANSSSNTGAIVHGAYDAIAVSRSFTALIVMQQSKARKVAVDSAAMFALLTDLTLRDPALLLLALSVPAALWTRRRRGEPTVTFAPAALIGGGAPLPRSWRTRLLALPVVLHTAALLLVIVAVARPVHRVQLPMRSEGIDILLCVDASSSMAANDMDRERTRLDLAKAAASQFITARVADRIGLLRFARYPDLLCPLTLDHGALQQILADIERVDPDSAEDMTGIGTAVARAAQILRPSPSKSRIVVLLTDGEENVATADKPDEIGPGRATLLAKELGVRVYTIAVGIGKRGPNGEDLPIDTEQVRQLAAKTGGAFFEARDAGTLSLVYATIDALEKVPFEEPRYELRERFLPFLLGALLLLLCGQALRATVFGVLP